MSDNSAVSPLQQPTLVINCGSSSIKYALISADNQSRITGLAENLSSDEARIVHKGLDGEKAVTDIPNADHKTALNEIMSLFGNQSPIAIGHRAVHGGPEFSAAVAITPHILSEIKRLSILAPLHNPANAAGIEAAQEIYPDLPQVVVFDTAFHQTMQPHVYRYPIPNYLYEDYYIRRYGFHGTSHAYVSNRASELTTTKRPHGWLVAHLGNGCSASAVYEGESQDTSMGLTPLEGLMMGTRSGDVDPGLHLYLHRQLDLSIEEIDTLLNKKSGLLGVAEVSNDMRTIEATAADDSHPNQADAKLAIEMFCYAVGRYLTALTCALPNMTGIAFTGGIGENASDIRARIVGVMRHFGLAIDDEKNAALVRGEEGSFHLPSSGYELWVIPTDEEYQIAQETRTTLDL